MKKRLLSAALALAMVLTMLPLTAFAANPVGTKLSASGTRVTWRPSGYTLGTDSSNTAVVTDKAAFWYWDSTNKTAHYAEDGFVSGTTSTSSGASGTWYPYDGSYVKIPASTTGGISYAPTSFVLLGANPKLDNTYGQLASTNYSVNLNGQTLEVVSIGKMTNLTVTDTSPDASSSTRAAGVLKLPDSNGLDLTDRSFILNVTNATVSNPLKVTNSLKAGSSTEYATSYTLNVTLKNAKVGALETVGGKLTVTANTPDKADQKNEIDSIKSNRAGSITLNKTDVTGTGDSIKLENGQSSLKATNSDIKGAVTVNGDSSTINYTNTKAVGTHNLTGISTSLTINGSNSQVGTGSSNKIVLCGSNTVRTGTAPKVIVNGGTVGDIEADTNEQLTNASYGVEVKDGGAASVGKIALKNAAINISGGTVWGITQGTGSLTVTNGSIGVPNSSGSGIVWGANVDSGKLALNISGANTVISKVEPATDTKVTLENPKISGGTFTQGVDLGGYKGNAITGGTFGGAATERAKYANWMTNIEYEVFANGMSTYMGSDFQALVKKFVELTTISGSTPTYPIVNTMDVVAGGSGKIGFYLEKKDSNEVASVIITGKIGNGMLVPDRIGSVPVSTWYTWDSANSKVLKTYAPGDVIQFPVAKSDGTEDVTNLYASVPGTDISDIVKITAGNSGVDVVLSGNVIRLSGSLKKGDGNSYAIPLTIETVKQSYSGNVTLTWFPTINNKFGVTASAPFGTGETGTLVFNGKIYTFDISGLKLIPSKAVDVKTSGDANASVKVKFNAGESASRPNYEKEMEGSGAINFNQSPSIIHALNMVAGNLSESQVKSYLDTADREYVTEKLGYSPNATELSANSGGFDGLEIRPFLNITVSAYKAAGTASVGEMTMNIEPWYYLYATSSKSGVDARVVGSKTGQRLSNLTDDYGSVEVELVLPTGFAMSGATLYVHHNGKYVYTDTSSSKGTTLKFTTTHGFSPFVINGAGPKVTVTNPSADIQYFDTLQEAVDVVKDNGSILINPYYGKNTDSVSVTGQARVFTVDCGTNIDLTLSFANAEVSSNRPTSNTYNVTLKANVAVTTTTVSVSGVTGGTMTANVTSTRPGQTVTLTAKPSAGYQAGTPTVRTNTGAAVSVSALGNNTFSFVVPAGATSISVTPSFVLNTGLPFTDVPATAWYFDGVKYCYNTMKGSNRLMEGFSATQFGPNSAFTRAEVVTILWNMKGRPTPGYAYRTYSDVPTSHWAYNAITWATNNGYAEGYPGGTFRPSQSVTREEMVVFLWRAAGKPAGYSSLSLNGYTDGYNVHDWAQNAMKWALAYGILSGQNSVSLGGTIAPRAVAYRSQVAVTVMNFDKLKLF